MRERSYTWLFWTLVLFGLGLDQVGKYTVFRWLYHDGQGGEYVLVNGVFKLLAQYTDEPDTSEGFVRTLRTWSGDHVPKVNHGALFGLGQNYQTQANLVFASVSILAACAITIWSFRAHAKKDFPLSTALGLILAGTLGNLYDRLVFGGVRDFLYFFWIEWPVFNVADCCLVCGAACLLLQAFFHKPKVAETPVQAVSTSTGSELVARI